MKEFTAAQLLPNLIVCVFTMNLQAAGTPSPLALPSGKIGIMGDSMASGTHASDMCGNSDIVDCVDNLAALHSRDWSYASATTNWSIASLLGYASGQIVDASDDGEEWKDALQQAQVIMADPEVESVLIGLGGNDVCQAQGHDYTGDLETIASHIDQTLLLLTDNLPPGGVIYWTGVPDISQIYEKFRARDHNIVFENCQATWDLDRNKVKDEAVSDACDHYFGGTLCQYADYNEEAKDLLVELFIEALFEIQGIGEGPCGKITSSDSSDQDRLEARQFTIALNRLMADKAQAYSGRNGVTIHYTDRVFDASTALKPYHLSRFDCYHPSRNGQMFIAEQTWRGFQPGSLLVNDTWFDEFDSQDYCTQEFTDWENCWVEIGRDEGGSPLTGDIQITDDRLRVRDNDKGIMRGVPLEEMERAWLSFNWRRNDLDQTEDYVTFDITPDAGLTWHELDRFKGDGSDYGMHRGRYYDISPYTGPRTYLRFLSSSAMGGDDEVYFDNMQIQAWGEMLDSLPAEDDFDGDGVSDILARNINILSYLRTDGEGVFISELEPAWLVEAVANLDGDVLSEVLVRNQVLLSRLEADGSATFIGGLDLWWNVEGTGDFNGDGTDDILVRSDTTLSYLETGGSARYIGGLDATWQVEGTGDFNGDGTDEILVRNDTLVSYLDAGNSVTFIGTLDTAWIIQPE